MALVDSRKGASYNPFPFFQRLSRQRRPQRCLSPSIIHRIGSGNGRTAFWYGAERKAGARFWQGGERKAAPALQCSVAIFFPTMARHRHILRHHLNFQRMFDEGTVTHTRFFTLFHRPNALSHNRIGIMVGRRYGNAVRRNRAKRMCREVTHHGRILLTQNTDILLLPKRGMDHVPYHVVNHTCQSLFASRGLIAKPSE